jgi:hypothetical protein
LVDDNQAFREDRLELCAQSQDALGRIHEFDEDREVMAPLGRAYIIHVTFSRNRKYRMITLSFRPNTVEIGASPSLMLL